MALSFAITRKAPVTDVIFLPSEDEGSIEWLLSSAASTVNNLEASRGDSSCKETIQMQRGVPDLAA
ncbi:hypothetical protein TRIATDRAFT_284377 [Trichoderma atroviride IMI 206040]|uniref:Uncharacterized protein n=1 Tax=Hypocrea atroviridis (strain ATCC 20476 / IMI 206040) TaxID=452589 RepID=G9NWX7_HYPAI|nr:uncharacterized protein TRIATDRAFT_284377 [Trichoderma atroviride IMI 206040]EHK45463.1 hypothetical protein TRIATDRAFT_284377 [Trichoderma atroviride IMI 206040]